PRPAQGVLDARYQHMSDIVFNLNGQRSRVRVFEHVIGYLMRRHPAPGRILDVGCFTGTLLEVAAGRGWEPWGVEINKVASGYARDQLGYRVHTGLLHDAALPGDHFDAVAATDTIEHLIDPLGSLREIHRVLKPGGHVVLTVPNARMQVPKENLKKRLGRGRGLVIGGLAHINHFTPQSIRRILRGVGFDGIEIHCSIPEGQQTAKVDRAKRAYVAAAEALRRATGLNIGHELLVIGEKAAR
ncbi:MAG: class I SAM-dependent methyltransferase, partial [Actinomycetota bacterium]